MGKTREIRQSACERLLWRRLALNLAQIKYLNAQIVDTGVAITTIKIPHPVNIETIASEIVLPSFERMDEVYVIKVA